MASSRLFTVRNLHTSRLLNCCGMCKAMPWLHSYIFRKTTMSFNESHYNDVTMDAMASQITSLKIVYSIVYSDADQRKHQSSASLAFVWGLHQGPVNSPHKWPVTWKMFLLMTPSCAICLCNGPLDNTLKASYYIIPFLRKTCCEAS